MAAPGKDNVCLPRRVNGENAVRFGGDVLASLGTERPHGEARILFRHALNSYFPVLSIDKAWLEVRDHSLSTPIRRRYTTLLRQRLAGRPLSRILAKREFWSLDFRLNSSCLDPRPDSETLVAALLQDPPDEMAKDGLGAQILDLGCGTGCLIASLLNEWPGARGVGVDISRGACAMARHNARQHGLQNRLRVHCADWHKSDKWRFVGPRSFDAIVTNPPYICRDELARLAPSVLHFDPVAALDGGGDGLDAYRLLLPFIAWALRPNGRVALEIHENALHRVVELINRASLRVRQVYRDLAGHNRCILATNQ